VFENWKQRHAQVIDSSRSPGSDPIYTIELHEMRKPHMIFRDGASNTEVATGTSRCMSLKERVDVNINGQIVLFKLGGFRKLRGTYQSPALGTTLTWQNKSSCRGLTDLECRGENGVVLAEFSSSKGWSMTKAGQLHVFDLGTSSDSALEEMVVFGLVMARWISQVTARTVAS
jgi:hypothetical protein